MRALVLLIALTTATAAAARGKPRHTGALPPIGERRYVIDQGQPFAPISIQRKDAPASGPYLKDPLTTTVRAAPPPPPKPAPRPARPVAKASQLRFKKLPVSGDLTRPRVEFTRETLPLDRADEPIARDFFDRVFEPARDDAF